MQQFIDAGIALGKVPALLLIVASVSKVSVSKARPHPLCNRMVQVRCVQTADNTKYFPIKATDKQVAFTYFTTLRLEVFYEDITRALL